MNPGAVDPAWHKQAKWLKYALAGPFILHALDVVRCAAFEPVCAAMLQLHQACGVWCSLASLHVHRQGLVISRIILIGVLGVSPVLF